MVSVLRYSNTRNRKFDPGNEIQTKEVRVAIEFSQRKTLKHAAQINIRSISVNRIIKEGGAGETQRGGADDVMQRKGGEREEVCVCAWGGVDLIQQQHKQTGVIIVKQQFHNRLENVQGGQTSIQCNITIFCLEMLFHF